MPTATLTFTLPEEEYEFRTAAAAGRTHAVLLDTDQFLRGLLKYGGLEKYTTDTLAEEIRRQLAEGFVE